MSWRGTPSLRELILDNVVTTLEGISVANGYELDVAEVTRVIRDIEDEIINELALSATPIHQIASGVEEPEPAGSGGLMRSTFSVVDWLIVASDTLEQAIKDTKVAMWADRRRGTHPSTGARLALDTRFVAIETAEGIYYPYELARIEWAIDYTHLETAP